MSNVTGCENTKLSVGGGELVIKGGDLTFDACGLLGTVQNMIDVTIAEAIAEIDIYDICEFYYFRKPNAKLGFEVADGRQIENVAMLYPEAWAYLQTEEGRALCKTENEWQKMHTATWHTATDGTKTGWNGVGGVPFYVVDVTAGTLRLPDLRGMYAEAAGFDSLSVGDVHGDAIRNITGQVSSAAQIFDISSGVFGLLEKNLAPKAGGSNTTAIYDDFDINVARQVPTANKNQPRAWGALACVYLGKSK